MTAYPEMIPVEAAKALIELAIISMEPIYQPIEASTGLVLAQSIYAPYAIPAYRQSSMDGYAIALENIKEVLPIVGEIPAGTMQPFELHYSQAVKIFTGAPVPDNADIVVMKEKCEVIDELLVIHADQLKKGDHIRAIGAEIQQGALAMEEGMTITPAAAGFLAGIGIEKAWVYPFPTITIIITGNEIQQPGTPLAFGKVYNANAIMLKAAFSQLGIQSIQIVCIEDDLQSLQTELSKAIAHVDMVIVSGGVSVGDYDFTGKAFEHCGIKKIFHKIRQKPGKPILFGMNNRIPVFGLPGNPASVLTCFYEYILPALGKMICKNMELKKLKAPLADAYKKPSGLTHFVKAFYDGATVSILTGQESFKLHTFAQANCLAVLPDASTIFISGDLIDIHILPL